MSINKLEGIITNRTESDVVIIGGGIIGLFCAYYLLEEGKSITVLDQGQMKDSCSYGNCGLVSPSHALPLNSPQLLLKAMIWLFQKNSPFYIKPQMDMEFLGWMMGFAFNSFNKKQLEKSMKGRASLLKDSRTLYEVIFKAHKWNCNWAPTGIHFVYSQERNFNAYKSKDSKLANLGLAAEPIIGKELFNKEPALSEHAYGSWFYKIDASVNPGKLLNELRGHLVSRGVEIKELCKVDTFKESKGRITEITTNRGVFKARDVVLATGAWTANLAKQLKLKIPVIPGKGYSITMKSPTIQPSCPIIFEENKVVVTPWKEGYRLGGTMEFSGYDTTYNEHRLQTLKNVANLYLKEPYTNEEVEDWYGWRPMTNNGLPIIDKSPVHNNLFVACGHNMLGLSMAPSTGKLITEMVIGKEKHLESDPYAFA
ncbi:NAD(P)/FAD-dependent oxidoreductase [Arenibacter troitsensis]|uniref:D-amino-acid dehydrogenase n=1 Tax=Arenibacter troitsensis TaxID=188872 RepID=A0A1X7I4P0_9FLAO|nr:FAD-dependent oxidoreductase [Arenibacter troitsensis]SMG08794.1 D-amino-acid dehydrogenase [Arenibacter troitsensis]